MKHLRNFEAFVNESNVSESSRIPTTLYPADFREYFSRRYEDIKQVYDRGHMTGSRIVQADNGKWYEVTATYNRWDDRVIKLKSTKAPK